MVGKTISHYRILEKLGEGGMGVVYKAEDTKLKRTVALKFLPPEALGGAELRARFLREAQAAAALSHPNVCTVFDVDEEAGFLAMEYVEGETVEARVCRRPLPLPEALDIATQTALGLQAAHEHGVVHRDIKSANLMVTPQGTVKIMDFGLARLTERTRLTKTGAVTGTPAYMSPEQAQGKVVDQRSDLWSLGVVLYEIVTGQTPFRGESATAVIQGILQTEPEPVTALRAGLPLRLDHVIAKALEKDPELRYQHAAEFCGDLKRLKRDTETGRTAATLVHEAVTVLSRPAPRRRVVLAALAAVVLGAALFVLSQRWERGRSSPPVFRQLTFRRGTIYSARFAPDGNTIVYGAYWDGRPVQLFSVRPESPESSPLPLPEADILSISSAGEMALSLGRVPMGWTPWGTLARAPLAGGAPRELLEMVQEAVWNSAGSALAVVRAGLPGGGTRLEYPAGKVLYQTEGWLSHPRFSPKGDAIAFAEHTVKADDVGHVSLVDLRGKKRDLTGYYAGGVQGIAWTPAGDEVWYTAAESGWNFELRAVSRRGGPSRVVLRVLGRLTLQDISRDGRVLVTRDTMRSSMMVRTADSDRERDLAWLDSSNVRDFSLDGTRLLFSEYGEGSQTEGAYLRKTDGSPAVRIGDGYGFGLSPDGRWALSVVSKPPPQLFLLPTGVGEPRVLPRGNIDRYAGFAADWFADSRRFVFAALDQGHERRLYIQDIQGGEPRAISGTGLVLRYGRGLSPDQKYVAAIDTNDRKIRIVPVEGGPSTPMSGAEPDELPAGWTADGRSLYVYRPDTEAPAKVHLVDVAGGQRKLWKEIMPADPAGTYGIVGLAVNPDGKSYVYTLGRTLSDLYLVEGLK